MSLATAGAKHCNRAIHIREAHKSYYFLQHGQYTISLFTLYLGKLQLLQGEAKFFNRRGGAPNRAFHIHETLTSYDCLKHGQGEI